MRPSRSRWTTRSPSASIRPRKRSSLSCSSHMRSASVSISARLRGAWSRRLMRRCRVSARLDAQRTTRPARPVASKRDGEEGRRAGQMRTGRRAPAMATTAMSGRRAGCASGSSGASGGAATSRRVGTRVGGGRVDAVGLFVLCAGFRCHARIYGRQRLGKILADRSNFSGQAVLPNRPGRS